MLDISNLSTLRTLFVDYDVLQVTQVRNVLLSMGYPNPMEVEWRAIIDSFYGAPLEVSQLERLIIRVLTGSSPETTRWVSAYGLLSIAHCAATPSPPSFGRTPASLISL